jgi:hypothetical protein
MQGLAAQEQHVTEPRGPAVEMEGVADGDTLCSTIITIPARTTQHVVLAFQPFLAPEFGTVRSPA